MKNLCSSLNLIVRVYPDKIPNNLIIYLYHINKQKPRYNNQKKIVCL